MPATPDPPSDGRSTTARMERRTPLPQPLTPLIARTHEIAQVTAQIRDPAVRLLTLTGPGGVGKTRLAIASAASAADIFPGGVVFVDLSRLRDPNLVLDTIAGAFGLRDSGSGALRDRLLATIADRRLLLVIDNFEQVVTAAPQLPMLLERCPGLILLVTSRIRLRISGEHEFPVAPLPLGGPEIGLDGADSGAVQLFVDRARALVPDFAPDDASQQAIGEIVRRVDGLPLAIELAAARSKALPPSELLKRMDQRLPLLSGGPRDLPLRQQTMRDAIGWSYDLLSESDQALFRRLGVFAGGFTLDAVAEMCGSLDYAIDGITTLIEHSLLQHRTEPDREPRYFMLETMREFAQDRLMATGELDAACRLHAEIYLALAEEHEPELTGPHQVAALDRLEREHDNLRAALRWSTSHPEPITAARLGAALWLFWRRRGYLSEGRAHIERILVLPLEPGLHAERCSMLTGAGALAVFQGEYDEAVRYSEAAIAGWRKIDDHRGIGRSLLCLAIVARHRDDYDRAASLGQESLTAFRAIDDRWGMGRVLGHLGMVAWLRGDDATKTAYFEEALAHLRAVGDQAGTFEILLEMGQGTSDAGDLARATTLFEESLALSTMIGDEAGRGAAMAQLGVVARRLGDYARATDLLTAATALAQKNGDRRQLAWVTEYLGDVDLAMGSIRSATARYAEALELFLPMGNRVGVAQCLEKIARCAERQGHLPAAISLLGSSAALFGAVGVTPPPDRDPATDAASLRTNVPPAEFAHAWNAGLAMSPDAAAAEALALAADLIAEGADESFETDLPSPASQLGLTARERDVLRLLADGMSDREIANALSISERTAGNHVQHAMQKIGVSSRTAAAVYAVRHGLV